MTALADTIPPDTPVVRAVGSDLPLVVCGMASALAVIVADWLTKGWLGQFAGYYVWVLLPVGAFGFGWAAASGYYLGAKWFQIMPSRTMLYNAVVTGLLTWVALRWIDWQFATFSDTHARVADSIGFFQYWQWLAGHSSLAVGTAGTVATANAPGFDVGRGGYVLQILQCLGFLAGGAIIYLFLSQAPACAACRRYFAVKHLTKTLSIDDLVGVFDRADLALPNVTDSVKAVVSKLGPLHGFVLHRQECPNCHALRLALSLIHGKNRSDTTLGAWGMSGEQLAHLEAAVRMPPTRPG